MIKFFRKIRYDLMEKNKTGKYLKYAIGEIILVVIGIVIALQLNNWKDAENNKISEQKILSEIRRGIWRDIDDFERNIAFNKRGLAMENMVKDYINKKAISQDSLSKYYNSIFNISRPVINKSGYESLKSSGLKTVNNDSLRFQIVQLYDFFYKNIEIGEERQKELQTFSNYNPLISKIYPFLEFDDNGDVISTSIPLLSDIDRKELLIFMDKVIQLREGMLRRYSIVLPNIKQLSVQIDKELGQYIPPEQLQEYAGTFKIETNETERDSSQKSTITFSVEDNYLTGITSWNNNSRSFFMIAPDKFESLRIFTSTNSKRILLDYVRDSNQNIIGINDISEGGNRYLKKIE